MNKWLLTIFAILVFLTRLIGLTNYPIGFTPDEAAFAYNAYALLLTGKDEWGDPWYKLWWQNMRSFGDYKLPLYAFLAVPTVGMLGLNEYATRLPSALFGLLAILSMGVIGYSLLGRKLGWLMPFLLAISSWHFSLSRGAFEANLVTTCVLLFVAGILRKNNLAIIVGTIFGVYAYHAGKFILGLLFLTWNLINTQRKYLFIALTLVLVLPGLWSTFQSGSRRAVDVSIFSGSGASEKRFEARMQNMPDWLARLFHNKLNYYSQTFYKHTLEYLSFNFLFTQGAGEWTYGMISGRGVLYLLDLLGLVGFLILFTKNNNWKNPLVIGFLFLVFICVFPASLTTGAGRAANRSASMVVGLTIMTSLGMTYLLKHPKHLVILLSCYLLFFISFVQDYVYHAPKHMAGSMLYGRKELFFRARGIADNYAKIIVSKDLSEPHIHLAFYYQIDPRIYQNYSIAWRSFESKGLMFLDQMSGYNLDKFYFGDVEELTRDNGRYLVLGKYGDLKNHKPYFSLDYPNGKTELTVFPTR